MTWRTVIAGLVAPVMAPTIYAIGMLAGSGYPYISDAHMEKFFGQVLFIVVFTYLPAIIAGFIIVYFLGRMWRLTSWWCLTVGSMAGFLLGIAFCVCSALLETGREVELLQPVEILSVGLLGALVALLNAAAFCLMGGLPFRKPRLV